jgi:hypothetical protein
MKIELTAAGDVTITPESGMEEYAMAAWCREWQSENATMTVGFQNGASFNVIPPMGINDKEA